VSIVRWEDFTGTEADLLVCGPGPGDPRSSSDPRIRRAETAVRERLSTGLPLLAVCLSHQVLAGILGFDVMALDRPQQGVQKEAEVFGQRCTVGFYNTFVARGGPRPGVLVSADGSDINALRGNGFESVQFHPESVLSTDGIGILSSAVHRLFAAEVSECHRGSL